MKIGEVVGNYRITGTLGEGGMGAVFAAEHQLIGRRAAIKVLHPQMSSNAAIVQRFFNEARATTLIKHPGLVDIFDFGHLADGSAYIAMEYLEGESLAAAIKRQRRMELNEIATLGRQAAAALFAAHEKGIVHRDLKPDNLFLVPDEDIPGGRRVKILDFGIAKLTVAENPGLKTNTGAVMGTPVYMSPEQCKGAGEVDSRSDIYSLGCVLYEMACGVPPFVKVGMGELIAAHIYEPPPAPSSHDPAISPDLESVILRALAKRPDDRQQTMTILRSELGALIGAAGPGRSTVPVPRHAARTLVPGDHRVQTTTTLMPVIADSRPTTLGGAARQSIAPAPSRRGIKLAVAGAAALVIASSALLLFPRHSEKSPSIAAAAEPIPAPVVAAPPPIAPSPVPAPAPAAAPPEVPAPTPVAADPTPVPPVTAHEEPPPLAIKPVVAPAETPAPPAAPPPPAKHHFLITSEPAGATVIRRSDGESMGITPVELELESSDKPIKFRLDLAGYGSEFTSFSGDHDAEAALTLQRAEAKKKTSKEPPVMGNGVYDPFQ